MGLLGHDTSVLGWLVHAKGVTGAMLFLFLKDLEDSLRSKRLFSHHCVCKVFHASLQPLFFLYCHQVTL